MSLADDIAAARKSGQSDASLLDAYKQYDPTKAGDIDSAIKGGQSAGDILDALGAYDAQYGAHTENLGIGAKIKGALQSGVSSELSGIGNTLSTVAGPGAVSGTLQSLGQSLAPQGYESASTGLGDTNKGLLDRAGYIPRAMLEAAPGLATDIAAGEAGSAIGGPIGGALGFGGSYLLRNFGNDAKASATARTGDPNAAPDTTDLWKAAGVGTAGAALSRVGVKTGLGGEAVKAGEGFVSPALAGLGKAAAVDAGVGVTQDALHQVVIDQTNPLDDPTGLALTGLQGASTGAALRTPGLVREANQQIKFRDIDPVNGGNLASLYTDKDFSTPSKAFDAMTDVDNQLGTLADHWQAKTQPQLKALQEANEHTDDTDLLLKGVRNDIANGKVVDDGRLDTLDSRLGDFHEGGNLVDTLRLQNTQNSVKQVGNFDTKNETFGGGLSASPFVQKYINPLGQYGKFGTVTGLGSALMGGVHLPGFIMPHVIDPSTGLQIAAAQTGLYGAAKGVDKLLGNTNPLGDFVPRFTTGDTAGNAAKPSFVQTLKDQQAQAKETKGNSGEGGGLNADQVADIVRKALVSQQVTAPQPSNDDTLINKQMQTVRQASQQQQQPQPAPPEGASTTRYVTHKGHTIAYDPSGVRNVPAYEAGIKQRLEDRQQVMDAAKATLPREAHAVIDTIQHSLNGPTVENPHQAASIVEDIANDHPAHTAAILDALDKPRLWTSFDRKHR